MKFKIGDKVTVAGSRRKGAITRIEGKKVWVDTGLPISLPYFPEELILIRNRCRYKKGDRVLFTNNEGTTDTGIVRHKLSHRRYAVLKNGRCAGIYREKDLKPAPAKEPEHKDKEVAAGAGTDAISRENTAYTEGRKSGMKETWEFIRKLTYMDPVALIYIFRKSGGLSDIIRNYDVDKAMEKIEHYEKKPEKIRYKADRATAVLLANAPENCRDCNWLTVSIGSHNPFYQCTETGEIVHRSEVDVKRQDKCPLNHLEIIE